MTKFEAKMNKDFADKTEEIASSFKQISRDNVKTAVQDMGTAFGHRLDRAELDIATLTNRMNEFEQASKQSEVAISSLRTAVAAAESTAPIAEALDLEDFDRELDLTIVRLRAQDAITHAALINSVDEIFKAMDSKPTDYKVIGQPLEKSFIIQFTGATALAARRARKFISLQRSDEGWKDFHAHTPDGSETRIYIDKDKNRKQIKTEVLGRKLLRILKTKFTAKDFVNQKRTGIINSNLLPLARIVVLGPESHKIEWQVQYMEELGIDRDDIDTAMAAATADSHQNLTWG
eukprot:10258372-Heterocapsa_arctica.AAC.1